MQEINTWYQVLNYRTKEINTWYQVLISTMQDFNIWYQVLIPMTQDFNTWYQVLFQRFLDGVLDFIYSLLGTISYILNSVLDVILCLVLSTRKTLEETLNL